MLRPVTDEVYMWGGVGRALRLRKSSKKKPQAHVSDHSHQNTLFKFFFLCGGEMSKTDDTNGGSFIKWLHKDVSSPYLCASRCIWVWSTQQISCFFFSTILTRFIRQKHQPDFEGCYFGTNKFLFPHPRFSLNCHENHCTIGYCLKQINNPN